MGARVREDGANRRAAVVRGDEDRRAERRQFRLVLFRSNRGDTLLI
jgi:hypothetical protein